MATAYEFGGWLAFDSLDQGSGIDRTFAIGYRVIGDSSERWSARFSRFKSGQPNARNAALAVIAIAAPQLIRDLNIDGESITFVPALGSRERVASADSALSKIAKACSAQCGSRLSLESLTKNPHATLHTGWRSREERASILSSAKYKADTLTTSHVFVIDDLVTSGATLNTIATAIKSTNPDVTVYGMALGKNAYRDQGFTNDHVPSEWEQVWGRYDPQ